MWCCGLRTGFRVRRTPPRTRSAAQRRSAATSCGDGEGGPVSPGRQGPGRMERQARDLNVISWRRHPDDHRSRACAVATSTPAQRGRSTQSRNLQPPWRSTEPGPMSSPRPWIGSRSPTPADQRRHTAPPRQSITEPWNPMSTRCDSRARSLPITNPRNPNGRPEKPHGPA